MSYNLAGGISNMHKHVTFYFHMPVNFKNSQSWLLDLQAGWYAYPISDGFNRKKYLLIQVKDRSQEEESDIISNQEKFW
jgi:hypothetical protein